MNSAITKKYRAFLAGAMMLLAVLPACTSVNTFPMVARAGDTVSVMVGGSELARKETVSVTLTDASNQTWDLKSLGLVRSVFNLRTEGVAHGIHYSPYLDLYVPWLHGHEPVQTVLVADLPVNANPGNATLSISTNAIDNSSGISEPFSVKLEILAGTGSSDQFLRKGSGGPYPVDFSRLEPSPYAKIDFGTGTVIGAASLTISFNSAVLNGNDINVYVPESTVRGSFASTGAFGATQRMVYWRQDGQKLYIDVVAPQGLDSRYLKLFLVHPRGLSASPNFGLVSVSVYDTSGTAVVMQPSLSYYP